ncbi:AsmA family protein [Affinirhizobium pseudoryzae]|uniref:AsmA family protein n=1 Tax=Allorhizobium pseudoryzae TaxID=379684 RepID=UPI0013EBE510|nr:AsmA family protein [Allorhizobium pseudoryzae]
MLGRILLVISGLVVVALFTALLAPFFVDWSSFRRDFETQASRILGKKVTVNGTVDARLLPFPSVTMTDVRVGQDTDGTPIVQVAAFSMDMELAPFLSGEARIFDMRLDRPKARIRVLKDGKLDWMRGSRPELPARNVVLEDVHVTGAEIEFIDEATGRTRRVTGLTAEMSATSLAGPWRAEGNATLDGYEAKFSLASGEPEAATASVPLRMKVWPDVQPVEVQLDGALALTEARPEYKGDFSLSFLDQPINPVLPQTTEKPVPPPRTKGKFELTNDRIRIAEYRTEIGGLDNPYVVTGEATLDTGDKPEFLLTAEGQQVDVNRLTADLVKGKTARNPHVSGQQRLNALIAIAARVPIPQVPGKATIRLPAIVADGTTIRDVRLDMRPAGKGWKVENAVATLPGRTQVEVQGALRLDGAASFTGRMLLASNQPSGLSDWLTGKVDPAIRQLKAAGFSATVNLTPTLQRFDNLELAVGAATLKGRVERESPAEATPTLSINLTGDEVDLDALRALASLMTGDDAGEDVLDHRLAAQIKAGRLTAFGIAAEKVETVLELGAGKLSLQKLTIGNVAGASITAKGTAEGSFLSYSGSGSLTFNAFDPTPFITMLHQKLPRHPLLDRLVRNAAWYADTNLSANVTLQDGALAARIGGRSNGSEVSADLDLPNLFDITADTKLDLTAKLANPQAGTLLGQMGLDSLPFDGDSDASLSLDLHQDGSKPARLNVAYATDRTRLSADGTANLSADAFGQGQFDMTLKSEDLEPTLLTAGIGLPQFGLGLPVDLSASLVLQPQAARFDAIRGAIGGNGVSGQVTLDRTASLTKASGEVTLDLVDLGWLGEAVYGPLTDGETGDLSDKSFALPMFAGTDLAFTLHARSLKGFGLPPAEEVSARLISRAGGVTIEEAKGRWLGGQIAGRVALSNSEGVGLFQTRLSVENADLASLVWQSQGKPVATGRTSFALAAEATAKTPAGLLAAASGSGAVHLTDLTLTRLNPDLLPSLLPQADGIQGEVTEAKVDPLLEALVHEGSATLGRVDIPFTMTGGQVRAQNITAKAGETNLGADLRIDLVEDALEASLQVSYAPGEEAVAGGDAAFKLLYSGALSAPSETLDAGAITNYLSLRAFERERRRVETLQASVLEKQRLRREVALYNFEDNRRRILREKAEAEAKVRAAEEARLAAEAEARARAAEEQRRREADSIPQLTVPPTGDVFRQNGFAPGAARD